MLPQHAPTDGSSPWIALHVAGHIGAVIAIPAVVFGMGGAYVDKYLDTSPIFMAAGFLLAFVTSGYAVLNIVHKVTAELNKEPVRGKRLPPQDDDDDMPNGEKSSFL